MAFVPMMVPWSPEHQMLRLQVTQKQLETEEQAAFPLGGAQPLTELDKEEQKWMRNAMQEPERERPERSMNAS